MIPSRQNSSRARRRLPVTWQDCVWFPAVQARSGCRKAAARRRVNWPVQIITDPTVCRARTVDLNKS